MRRIYESHWNDDRWARFRLRIVTPLLKHPPEYRELHKRVAYLARKLWRHPLTGKQVAVSAVSIMHWYYKAKWESDPLPALQHITTRRKTPSCPDAGIYVRPRSEMPHRRGVFGSYFDCFAEWMKRQGYSLFVTYRFLWHVTHFGRYLSRTGSDRIQQLDGLVGRETLITYVRYLNQTDHADRIWGVLAFVKAMQEAGVLTEAVTPNILLLPVIREYAQFLKDCKGVCQTNIRIRHLFYLDKFLRFLGYRDNTPCLPAFGIADIDRFIVQFSVRVKPSTIRNVCGVLSGFCRFLYQTGKQDCDLARLIERPRQYKLQFVPTVLKWPDVEKLFATVDCSSPVGLRDYAILRLLTTYGLRAGEAARMRLGDIDWRKETIHIIPGKTGRDRWLPLTPDVGNAIIAYLRQRRPHSPYREVFLLSRAPWTPIGSLYISYMVSRCIRLAGLRLPRGGAHILRHSFATRLFRDGISLKAVGDVLGHINPESTHIYTKSAVERLHEVALELPEVKPCRPN